MTREMPPDEISAAWQSQVSETGKAGLEDVTRLVTRMETRMRRNRIDLAIAMVLTSVAIVTLAAMFGNKLLSIGAAVSLAGFAVLTYEVIRHSRRAPVAENGAVASLDFHRALLKHRLDFHRTRLWLRVLTLAPGGVLFFLGLAAARPAIAPWIYFQLATFVTAIVLIVPVNRRAAAKLELKISELERLHGQGSSTAVPGA